MDPADLTPPPSISHASSVNAIAAVTRRSKVDSVAAAAVDTAREALAEEVDPADVGEHLGVVAEGERVVSHQFACTRRGYVGWHWSVTVARASRQRHVTVDEVVLVPGDMSPGDLLPVDDDDPRLVPTYSFGDDPLDTDAKAQVRQVAKDLGLGRVRTLSPEGRDLAAQRWTDGDGGPDSPIAQAAPDRCYSCGFLMRIAGPLAEYFGVCANGDANEDGRVVTFDHGCGAHSEVRLAKKHEPVPIPDHVFDTLTVDEVEAW
jgi:hypothetical protein